MDKPDHRIIDCHVHLSSIAEINRFLAIMDAVGVSAVNALALVNPMPPWWAKPDTPDWHRRDHTKDSSINLASVLFKALHPDRVYVFGGLDHSKPEVLAGHHDYAQQARTLVDMGVDGFKMWEGGAALRLQTGLPLDSPVYDEYYSLLESESLPILYHVNEPYRQEIDRLLPKHPNLKIIFAHFYGASRDLERLRRFFDAWPNVYVDLAPGMIFRGLAERRDEAREFFIQYQDRILFGTDTTAGGQEDAEWGQGLVGLIRRFLERRDDLGLAEIGMGGLEDRNGDLNESERLVYRELSPDRGLYLDDGVLKKIYAGNFMRIAGAKASKANPEVALSECEKLLERLRKRPADPAADMAWRQAEHLREVEQIAAHFRAMV
jgi:hypothetical protein